MKKLFLLAVLLPLLSGCLFSKKDGNVAFTTLGGQPLGSLPPAAVENRPPVAWTVIQEDPRTCCPEGLPPNARTTTINGEWVVGESGTQYYIPFSGARGSTYDEVLAAVPEPLQVEDGGLAIGDRLGAIGGKLNPGRLWPFGSE